MRRVLIIVGILLLPLVPILLVVTGVLKKEVVPLPKVTLTIWNTQDEEEAFDPVILKYRATHPNITIKYQKVRSEDYARQLRDAWAQGTGPDIFFVPNSWVGEMSAFATAMPKDLTIGQLQLKKTLFGTTSQAVKIPEAAPSVEALREGYVDVVMSDIYLNGKVWGLPLAMDTLVTYYNQDLLNNAKIFEPAKTWPELARQIIDQKLTVTDDEGNIVQSGAALGTMDNVPYSTDLLTLLIMQNGAVMVDDENKVKFNSERGRTAVDFYTSFARPVKETYSWNALQPNALDAFRQGRVAYYFGTLKDREAIADSGVNFRVGPMLHLSAQGDTDGATNRVRTIDVSRYQIAMVSKASQLNRRSLYAWNFLRYMANSSNINPYLSATNQLAAHKKILTSQRSDLTKGVFASQLLTARSWYHGTKAVETEGYLKTMVTSFLTGQATLEEAMKLAADQIENTL